MEKPTFRIGDVEESVKSAIQLIAQPDNEGTFSVTIHGITEPEIVPANLRVTEYNNVSVRHLATIAIEYGMKGDITKPDKGYNLIADPKYRKRDK